MCQIDQREGTVSFATIRRVLRELFAKNHGGGVRSKPLQVRRLSWPGTQTQIDSFNPQKAAEEAQ